MDCLVPAYLDKLEICIESDIYVNKPNQLCQDEDICDECIEEMAANYLDVVHNATAAKILCNTLRPFLINMIGLQ